MTRYLIPLLALVACAEPTGDSAATITIGLPEGAEVVTPYRVEIPAGESLTLQPGAGWQVLLCSGGACRDYTSDYSTDVDGEMRVVAPDEGSAWVVVYR